jgi:hypothetical protein
VGNRTESVVPTLGGLAIEIVPPSASVRSVRPKQAVFLSEALGTR